MYCRVGCLAGTERSCEIPFMRSCALLPVYCALGKVLSHFHNGRMAFRRLVGGGDGLLFRATDQMASVQLRDETSIQRQSADAKGFTRGLLDASVNPVRFLIQIFTVIPCHAPSETSHIHQPLEPCKRGFRGPR